MAPVRPSCATISCILSVVYCALIHFYRQIPKLENLLLATSLEPAPESSCKGDCTVGDTMLELNLWGPEYKSGKMDSFSK